MARTKQTARRSTGGKVPKKLLATGGFRLFRGSSDNSSDEAESPAQKGNQACCCKYPTHMLCALLWDFMAAV